MGVPTGLADSVAVAKTIHERGGGIASSDQLAAFLGYKSSNNGAFFNRVSAAKMFGLVESEVGVFRLTSRAQAILTPTYPEDAARAVVDAFLDVPLFKAVYDETKGQQLPPEFGLKNLLRNKFSVGPTVVDTALRTLMASAEDAGFFATRGSRTHLIMPAITSGRAGVSGETPREDADSGKGGGSGGGHDNGGDGSNGFKAPFQVVKMTTEELKSSYIAALIGLLRDKGPEPELMTRIEKLLGVDA